MGVNNGELFYFQAQFQSKHGWTNFAFGKDEKKKKKNSFHFQISALAELGPVQPQLVQSILYNYLSGEIVAEEGEKL